MWQDVLVGEAVVYLLVEERDCGQSSFIFASKHFASGMARIPRNYFSTLRCRPVQELTRRDVYPVVDTAISWVDSAAAKRIVNRCVKHFCVNQPKLTAVIFDRGGGVHPPYSPPPTI